MSRMIKKSITVLVLLGIVATAYYYYQQSRIMLPADMYRLQPITQGDVAQSVSANGTLNPVTLISVGTQVSGRVSKLFVDFNDHVEKGQILLTLDNSLFAAQIAQSEGNVRNVQATLELAVANEARIRSLFAQDYVSRQELDQAVQVLKSARAQLATARGQLRRDQTNLDFAIIRSPVSGVVVDRVVDVGQTVAASFQTPTLIKIAQDLSKMQIDSSFAEADIGNIKVGQKAKFSVDAFQNRTFEGVVKQLRLNPTVTSNVVTYNVVVSVDNPDKTLLPGMTAYVNIVVAEHANVMLVPNAALRFKPKQDDNQSDQAATADSKLKESPTKDHSAKASSRKKNRQEDVGSGKVYVISAGKVMPLKVNIGLTDGRVSEISGADLKLDELVIVGENQSNADGGGASGSMRFRMF
jgi:HlyD family secretion protein